MRWMISRGLLGLAALWLGLAPVSTVRAACADASVAARRLVVVLDAGPAMDAPATPFSTRRDDAELLLAALNERLAPGTTLEVLRYTPTPPQTFAAAIGAAAHALQVRSAPHSAIILIGAGMPAHPAAHAVAPEYPTLALDLADDAALAAWAGRHGVWYVPMAASRAQAFAERLAALDTTLRRFLPTAPQFACSPVAGAVHSLQIPAAWWALGLGCAGLLAIAARRLPRNRSVAAPQPVAAELRTATLHTSAHYADTPPNVDAAHALEHPPARAATPVVYRAWWRRRGNLEQRRIVTARGSPGMTTAVPIRRHGSGVLRPGRRLGAYVILWKLGVGGQAQSYLALGPGARRVVLKVAHPGAEAALYNEHAWLSRPTARHPHLVRLASGGAQATLGVNAGCAAQRSTWLALTYVPGQPLSAWMERRLLTLDQITTVALQTAQALNHLEQALGAVHQDVAPANLIVRRRWSGALSITLIDLGSAVGVAARYGTASGTEPYVAPERLLSPPAPPDPLSDIFALGVVLRRLTAGRIVPSELADLITAMTLPDPVQRRAAVPTWQAVVARLEGICKGVRA